MAAYVAAKNGRSVGLLRLWGQKRLLPERLIASEGRPDHAKRGISNHPFEFYLHGDDGLVVGDSRQREILDGPRSMGALRPPQGRQLVILAVEAPIKLPDFGSITSSGLFMACQVMRQATAIRRADNSLCTRGAVCKRTHGDSQQSRWYRR